MSRARARLRDAPVTRCPHCGRDTKTVDGVCADCWGSKGGRKMGWEKEQPGYRGGGWEWWLGPLLDPRGCLPWSMSVVIAAVALAWALLT